MPDAARERQRGEKNTTGIFRVVIFDELLGQSFSNTDRKLEKCFDTSGYPHLANPFEIRRYDASKIELLHGIRPEDDSAYSGSGYLNWPCIDATDGVWRHRDNEFTDKPNGSDFARLCASTNPSKASVSPLGFVQDLVTLPKLIKDTLHLAKKGRRGVSRRDIANAHLSTMFGWMPLVDDVRKLLDLQKRINKRIEEVERMFRNGGQTRSMKFGKSHAFDSGTISLASDSAAGSASGLRTHITEAERWGSVRWIPDEWPTDTSNFLNKHQQVTRAVEGLTYNELVAGAWDLVPWTWVADWFADVGSFIRTKANTIPAHYDQCCIMTRTTTRSSVEVTNRSTWLSGGGGSVEVTTLRRDVGSPDFIPHLPFIGANRLSILGSLFCQRFDRG